MILFIVHLNSLINADFNLKITKLNLTNFKNYKSESFVFNPKYNAIVGYNGMGKTNLLDALYFTCMTKSNFLKQDRGLVLDDAQFMRIEAFVEDAKLDKVVCKYEKGKKKVFELNSKAYDRLSEHVGKFPVVFVVPSDQQLITEGSKERRKLIDNTISQLDTKYLQALYEYNSLLNQRNAYLKIAGKTPAFNETLSLTYSERMLEAVQYIHEKRIEFVNSFGKTFSNKYQVISNNQEVASCEYKSQLLSGDFMELTKENVNKDRYLGRTSIGTHKDDLIFLMDGKSVKNFASQGQTKSFVLSIKLSQYEIISKSRGVKPILLLDDLFDKLDNQRVEQLIELLEQENVNQVFISDTDEDRIINILKKMNVNYQKVVIQSGKQMNYEKAGEEE